MTQRSKRKVFFVFFECQISNLQLGTFWRARFPHSPIDINYVYNTRLKLYAWSVRKCFPISCHRNNNLTHERNIKKKAMRISPFCTVLSRAVCCICTANDAEKYGRGFLESNLIRQPYFFFPRMYRKTVKLFLIGERVNQSEALLYK